MKINKRKKYLIKILLAIIFWLTPFLTLAQFDPTWADSTGLSRASVYDIIRSIMMWLLAILTIVAVIGFIISGFMFIFGGVAGKIENGKNGLIYSIIGVAVALSGYIIIRLVDYLLLAGY